MHAYTQRIALMG